MTGDKGWLPLMLPNAPTALATLARPGSLFLQRVRARQRALNERMGGGNQRPKILEISYPRARWCAARGSPRTITAQNVRRSQREAVANTPGRPEPSSGFYQPKRQQPEELLRVRLPFPFETSRKSPPGRHQSQSRRGEPHPIQEPRSVAARAVSSLPLWSIIHIKERMKEKRKEGGGGGPREKPARKTRGEGGAGRTEMTAGRKGRGHEDGASEAAAAAAPGAVFRHRSINSSSNHSTRKKKKKKKGRNTPALVLQSEMEDSRNGSAQNGWYQLQSSSKAGFLHPFTYLTRKSTDLWPGWCSEMTPMNNAQRAVAIAI